MNCIQAEKLIGHLISVVVVTMLRNSRDDDGTSESYIVLKSSFCESLAFLYFNICEYRKSIFL